MRIISEIGVDYLDDVEGREHFEYLDNAGYPTIGIGHLLEKSELTSGKIIIGTEIIRYRHGLTDEQMDTLFTQDIYPVMDCIHKKVKVPLTQFQFDALCSFVFNVGMGAFTTSTLLRFLNRRSYQDVPYQLSRWNKSRNKHGELVINKGLVNRRKNDILLWQNNWRRKYEDNTMQKKIF